MRRQSIQFSWLTPFSFAFYSVDEGIQYAERDLFSGFQGRIYSLKYGWIAWKSNPAFSCDELITDPHCQLACLCADGFDFDIEFLLEQRRNTSSARSMLRDAVAYPHTPFIPSVFNHSDVSPRPQENIAKFRRVLYFEDAAVTWT